VRLNQYLCNIVASAVIISTVGYYFNTANQEWSFFALATLSTGLVFLNIFSPNGDIPNAIRSLTFWAWLVLVWMYFLSAIVFTQGMSDIFQRFVICDCLTVLYLGYLVFWRRLTEYMRVLWNFFIRKPPRSS
jgi:hypothetical protein